MSAGACGAFVGTPAEISLIRMTADGNLPAAERRLEGNISKKIVAPIKIDFEES